MYMVKSWGLTLPGLNPSLTRRAYVCLPPSYETAEEAFPVLYLFDGQNLFFDEEATYGQSWELEQYMQEHDPHLILAAVESSPIGDERLMELSPFTHDTGELGLVHGRARTMMQWLIGEFKPMIDRTYRTLPDRENTYIGGSSMGGLMALFGVLRYNDIFSRAACLSPSLWVSPRKVHRMCQEAHPAEHTLVYMDYGTEEIGNHPDTYEALLRTCRDLLQRSVDLTFRIDPYGTHSEASWAQRVPFFMRCLGLE